MTNSTCPHCGKPLGQFIYASEPEDTDEPEDTGGFAPEPPVNLEDFTERWIAERERKGKVVTAWHLALALTKAAGLEPYGLWHTDAIIALRIVRHRQRMATEMEVSVA
jgi:hypothetical protein